MEWILFVFKRGKKVYLVNGENEADAWCILQKRISWNMDIVKKQFTLITTMSAFDNIKTIE